MNPELFLIARIPAENLDGNFDWLTNDSAPFASEDPLDFLMSGEIAVVHKLYRSVYAALDEKLNVPMPEALLEFNRWVLMTDTSGRVRIWGVYSQFMGLSIPRNG